LLLFLLLFVAEVLCRGFAVITQNRHLKIAVVEKEQLFIVFHFQLLLHSQRAAEQTLSEEQMQPASKQHASKRECLNNCDATALQLTAAQRDIDWH
jgi:hypothetical protein